MITMTLGGLWHGAAWTFVAWGVVHGLILAGERALGVRPDDSDRLPALRQVPAIVAAFLVWNLTLVPFRASSLGNAGEMLASMSTGPFLPSSLAAWGDVLMVAGALVAVFAVDVLHRARPARLVETVRRPLDAPVASGALTGAAVVALVMFSGSPSDPFIYFQF